MNQFKIELLELAILGLEKQLEAYYGGRDSSLTAIPYQALRTEWGRLSGHINAVTSLTEELSEYEIDDASWLSNSRIDEAIENVMTLHGDIQREIEEREEKQKNFIGRNK